MFQVLRFYLLNIATFCWVINVLNLILFLIFIFNYFIWVRLIMPDTENYSQTIHINKLIMINFYVFKKMLNLLAVIKTNSNDNSTQRFFICLLICLFYWLFWLFFFISYYCKQRNERLCNKEFGPISYYAQKNYLYIITYRYSN